MKKILGIILILFFINACSKHENVVTEEDNVASEDDTEIVTEVDEYVDDNPITVGLYDNGVLVTNYKNKYQYETVVANFDVYFTNEENVYSNNTKYNFNRFYQEYNDIDNYRIGFYISFKVGDTTYEKVILDPDVEFYFSPYIYIYIYDDVNVNDGEFYSHLTKDTYDSNSIFSSIKILVVDDDDKIISPISLTVFTYDGEEDFDENGYYRGNSFYKVDICNE